MPTHGKQATTVFSRNDWLAGIFVVLLSNSCGGPIVAIDATAGDSGLPEQPETWELYINVPGITHTDGVRARPVFTGSATWCSNRGNCRDVTREALWQIDDVSVARVLSSGRLETLCSGRALLRVRYQETEAQQWVVVALERPVGCRLYPLMPTLSAGARVELIQRVATSDGLTLDLAPVGLRSTNPSVAQTIGSAVLGISPGMADIVSSAGERTCPRDQIECRTTVTVVE